MQDLLQRVAQRLCELLHLLKTWAMGAIKALVEKSKLQWGEAAEDQRVSGGKTVVAKAVSVDINKTCDVVKRLIRLPRVLWRPRFIEAAA